MNNRDRASTISSGRVDQRHSHAIHVKLLMLITGLALMAVFAGCQSSKSNEASETKPAVVSQAKPNEQQPKEAGGSASSAEGVKDGPVTQERVKIPFQLDNEEFKPLLKVAQEGPIIPGLKQGVIPQGLAYDPSHKWLLVSSYQKEGKPSILSVLEADSGKLLKSVVLSQEDGSVYTGHAGGVAVSKQNAWISSGGVAYRLPLASIEAAQDGEEIRFDGSIKTDVRASFTTYHNGVLWVGEFALGKDYETNAAHVMTNRDGKEHKAWIVGYQLDEETDHLPAEKQGTAMATPDYVLSVQDRVQGIAFWNDWIVISDSYGRNAESTLVFHENPFALSDVSELKPHAEVSIEGKQIPLWYLDDENRLSQIDGPPMSEGIAPIEDQLLILYESAASEVLSSGSYPLDTMLKLDKDAVQLKK